MANVKLFKQGDSVIIIDSPTWPSLIGKSATVTHNDANKEVGDGWKKVKVDYEDGWVGWLWPRQLKLDNDIRTMKDIVKHLDSMLANTTKDVIVLERKHVEDIQNIIKIRSHLNQ